jgi:hypothetical protein
MLHDSVHLAWRQQLHATGDVTTRPAYVSWLAGDDNHRAGSDFCPLAISRPNRDMFHGWLVMIITWKARMSPPNRSEIMLETGALLDTWLPDCNTMLWHAEYNCTPQTLRAIQAF